MNDRKLGVFLWYGYRIPVPERIRQIREAGFETVLHWWDDSFREEEGLSKEEQACLIRSGGLTIEKTPICSLTGPMTFGWIPWTGRLCWNGICPTLTDWQSFIYRLPCCILHGVLLRLR